MPGGRPSKIHDVVEYKDPHDSDAEVEQITRAEAICRYVALGSYKVNAAGAFGISTSTLSNWERRAAEWVGEGVDSDAIDLSVVPERDRPFVEFVAALIRAERTGLVWHELNVRRAAAEKREAGGRLSLEYLARRQPERYAKRIEIDHDPADREPAPVDAPTLAELEEAFDAAHVPEGIDPASVLPTLAAGGEDAA